MKKIAAFVIIGISALAFGACQEEEVAPEKSLSGITQDDKAWD